MPVALTAVPSPPFTTALVAGGLGLAVEPMAAAVERMVVDAADDVLVLVDLNCRPDGVPDRDRYLARLSRVLARADVVKASVEDLAYTHPTMPAAVAAAQLVSERTRAVLLTAGAARHQGPDRGRPSGWCRSATARSSTPSAPATGSRPASSPGG